MQSISYKGQKRININPNLKHTKKIRNANEGNRMLIHLYI